MSIKVIVICPHTDDGGIGAGGTTARFLEEGIEVHYVVLSVPSPEFEEECMNAIKSFKTKDNGVHLHLYSFRRQRFLEQRQDILQILCDLNMKLKPNLVFIPSTYDRHQDHQVATNEAIRAFNHSSILGYIINKNCKVVIEDVFIPFEEEHLLTKQIVLSNYHSQRRVGRIETDPEYVRVEAYMRGTKIGKSYAETFEVIRVIM